MQSKEHWERVYTTKATDAVSWFQESATQSIDFINKSKVPLSASIIDIGGGASILIDNLVAKSYSNLSVLDLSGAALLTSQNRLKEASKNIKWIEGNILDVDFERHSFDLWHDRAVFHFLTNAEDRKKYIDLLSKAVKPNGHIIIATFAEDGPLQCSGLPVMRYSVDELHSELGQEFTLIESKKELHQTPFNTVQSFIYCYFRR
jgi:ubiquinone/menaquinone biosynthesis C-methylase UbiE